MVSRTDKCGILFGSLFDLTLAIIAMTVIGILVNHNSGALLARLVQESSRDYNVFVQPSQLVNTTEQLQDEIGERNMNCSTTNAEYVMTNQRLDALSVDALHKALNDTISGCLNRTQALEQLVATVGMELTPNLPTVVQSGTVTATLDGSGSLSTTYSVNEITFGTGDELHMTYLLLNVWPGSLAVVVDPSPVLRFNGFTPGVTNVGICAGVRPILVNRFDGVQFVGYELDCSVAGGELRLYGQPVTTGGGVLQLLQPLSLFGQFL